MCRALHDNHNEGHIWKSLLQKTYRNPSPGSVKRVFNRNDSSLGGVEFGKKIEGIQVISEIYPFLWAIVFHAQINAIGLYR